MKKAIFANIYLSKIESNGQKSRNANFSVIFLNPKYTLFMDKVQVFRKGHKNLKKYSTFYDTMSESQISSHNVLTLSKASLCARTEKDGFV